MYFLPPNRKLTPRFSKARLTNYQFSLKSRPKPLKQTTRKYRNINLQLAEKIQGLLVDQRTLQDRRLAQQTKKNAMKVQTHKTKIKEVDAEIGAVGEQLHTLTLTLTRLLKTHPSVAMNLLKIQGDRLSLQNLISIAIKDLKGNKFTSLASHIEENYRTRNLIQNTINRYEIHR